MFACLVLEFFRFLTFILKHLFTVRVLNITYFIVRFIRLSTETLEEMFQEDFKILLETISSSNEVNEIVKEKVTSYFCDCEREEGWSDTFESLLTRPLHDYFEALARIFKFLDQNINKDKLIRSEDIVDLTFLAHGQVKGPLLPCKLHYMNGYVQSITLYEPWGCAIDATAAYGILTGTIRVNEVRYFDIPIYLLIYLQWNPKLLNPLGREMKLGSKNWEFENIESHLSTMVWLLWLIFFLGFNFISLCFKLIIIHDHTQKQRETKFKPRIKLNHNMAKKASSLACQCMYYLYLQRKRTSTVN